MGMAATVDQQAAAFYEMAVSLFDTTPGAGVGATPWSSSVGDPLTGANLAYSLRFPSIASKAANAGPFRLGYDKDSKNPFFFQGPSAGFAIVGGSYVFLAIPLAELDGAITYRQFTFYQQDVGGASAVDLAPESTGPMAPLDLKAMVQLP
jgi:hypothetical protein